MMSFISTCLIALSLLAGHYTEQPVHVEEAVPILMYHEIGTPEGPWKSLYVTEENFKAQIQYLKEQGYQTITMAELEKNRAGIRNLPNKPIVLSFDDGYASMYHFVYPLLKEHNMKATFYVFPDKFGTYNSLLPEQIKKMSDGGMEFGSHSMSHPDLSVISFRQLQYEIDESKKILEDITEKKITSFCYPAGRYNQEVIEQLRMSGYQSAVTTKYGLAHISQDIFELHRIRINYEDSLSAFSRKIQ